MQFQITNITDWVYKNSEPQDLLQALASREVVRYLAGSDLNEILSHGRLEAASALRDSIQAASNEKQLGAKIVFVGLQDIHPPTASDVAITYEKVLGAMEEAIATNNYAQAFAIRTNALATATAFSVTNIADANRVRVVTSAYARAALLTNQIPAYQAAPSVYRQRLYLQNFAAATRNARKYILLVTNTQDVVIFDLEDKVRADLDKNLNKFAMKKNAITIVVAIVLLLIFVLLLFTFQVRQSEVAVVSTFGKPADTITNAGLYVKWPWPIQSINRFDQRVQTFADITSETPTADQTMLVVNVFVGWRISDAKEFFPKFPGGSALSAQIQLERILRSAKAAVVGRHNLADFVNSDATQLKFAEIEKEIQSAVAVGLATNNYGISIEFLGIKKLGLPENVTQAVFDRMKAERTKLIYQAQYEGEAEATKIKSAAERQAADVIAYAQADATRIQGAGDAEAAKSFSVFQQNPQLAVFQLQLEALKNSMNQKSTLIFDERWSPFSVFQNLPANANSK